MAANARLRNAERIAFVGTLSAGLGHDVANLLVPIRLNLDSLARLDLPAEAAEHLAGIKSSTDYLQKLSSGLRLLASDPARAIFPEPTELGDWWSETGTILKNILPPSIALDSHFPRNTWVTMTRSALMQVAFNLVRNAGDAMREQGTGRVVVTAARDGDRVNLVVSDTGPGMTDEVKKRCMEPFFSTKNRSMSTGLGLSLVYGLVREAGGEIEVESHPGKGTTFVLRLKRSNPPQREERNAHRTVLVQLADARQRAIVTADLRTLGFNVVSEVGDAVEPDLVVSDDVPTFTPKENVKVVLFADREQAPASTIALGRKPAVQDIRRALREATAH
jgi:signal transduction histidine kinase